MPWLWLAVLVKVAGTRWNVEEDCQTGKELTALDEHQVRGWTSWQRWAVLAMLAHAFLTVLAAEHGRQRPAPTCPDGPLPTLIPLTRNEIRHLFVPLSRQVQHTIEFILRWSLWRRHRQADARAAHYRRRAATG